MKSRQPHENIVIAFKERSWLKQAPLYLKERSWLILDLKER